MLTLLNVWHNRNWHYEIRWFPTLLHELTFGDCYHSWWSGSDSPGHLSPIDTAEPFIRNTSHFLQSRPISNTLLTPDVLMRTFKKAMMWLLIHPPQRESSWQNSCYILYTRPEWRKMDFTQLTSFPVINGGEKHGWVGRQSSPQMGITVLQVLSGQLGLYSLSKTRGNQDQNILGWKLLI